MASVLPFLRVADIAQTIDWYERIGFNCLGTHEEPGCGLDWAMMEWSGAKFMLYPYLPATVPNAYNTGLYFEMDTIDGLLEKLQEKVNIFEVLDETEYGRKEITFYDCNNYQLTFSCLVEK